MEFFFSHLTTLIMLLLAGGAVLSIGLAVLGLLLVRWRKLAWWQRSGGALVALAICCGSVLPFVKPLGMMVGGTTIRGESGQAVDGTYYLFASWREDGKTTVPAETFWALYWCEHYLIPVAYAILFVIILAFQPMFRRAEEERLDAPAHSP